MIEGTLSNILWVLLGSLFLFMLMELPVACALGASCVLTILMVSSLENSMIEYLGQAMVTTVDSFPLLAVPFFMLVGTLMARSGLARQIIEVGDAFTGDSPGGLGSATIVACTIFAAISGSGPAVVAALGTILVPAMVDRGYAPAYAGALVATGATIGPVIPPSIPMIIFGVVGGTSVSAMFAGGVLPGLVMSALLILVNRAISRKRGYLGHARPEERFWRLKKCWEAKWALFLPVLILGGIYGGMFTPTEAAVVGSVYALAVGRFVYGQLDLANIRGAIVEAGLLSSTAMFVLGGATTFGRILTIERIPQVLAERMLAFSSSPFAILSLIMFFLLISGMFIDTISNVILFTPLFLPVVVKLGYHPVFFGVLMAINLAIGMVTPPVGVNLYVAKGVCRSSFESLARECLPLIGALLLAMLLSMLFPELVMFLPRLLGLV